MKYKNDLFKSTEIYFSTKKTFTKTPTWLLLPEKLQTETVLKSICMYVGGGLTRLNATKYFLENIKKRGRQLTF